MSEYNQASHGCFNDYVPIKVNRIFDSCSDKDCLSNIQVTLEEGELPENINIVKSRCVKVEDVCINVEAIPFNRGFFSIDITFTFSIEILAYEKACGAATAYKGTAFATKNCILYGSESATKTFFSNDTESVGDTNECCVTVNLPTASVSVVEPIVLETKIGTSCTTNVEKTEANEQNKRSVIVTLGLFSVVELTRPVTIMVPTVDYTIPKKECCADTDSPCEIFDKLKFPESEFSPVTINDSGICGCAQSNSCSDECS